MSKCIAKRRLTATAHSYSLIARPIVKGFHNLQFQPLSDRLVAAEHAHIFHQTLEDGRQLPVSVPLPKQPESVGWYYEVPGIQRFGLEEIEQAANLSGRVDEKASLSYRIETVISLAANSFPRRDCISALSLHCEADLFSSSIGLFDPYASLQTQKVVAVIDRLNGNHRGAVSLLERLFPLVHAMRTIQPHAYCEYLNSLAVELWAVGRLKEARHALRIVLAPPFATAYPEWREAYDQIELRGYRASRDTVALHDASPQAFSPAAQEPGKLMRLPLPERRDTVAADSAPGSQAARVLSLQDWKTKMVKQSNGAPQDQTPRPTTSKEKQAAIKKLGKMTTREKLLRIMKVIGDERVGDDLLLKALIVLEELELDENSGS